MDAADAAEDVLRPEALRPYLQPGGFGAAVCYCASAGSTQQEALTGAAGGAAEGTLYLAESQTQGRGRHGHQWSSPPGAGIYASLLLRPLRPAAQALPLTLASALAAADAVRAVAGVEAEIRWPNDLLLGGRKFCGLLLEASGEVAVLGFGINVRQQAWPQELAPIATALDEHTARPTPRAALCGAVVVELERRYRGWSAGRDRELLAEFAARCPAVQGCTVVVGGAGAAPFRGRTAGLDASGFLRVRRADGSLHLATTGDVRKKP